jgi:hypothetical protein
MNRWGGRAITKEQREEILQTYLRDPVAATAMAVGLGLSAAYAYKLALERGVLPITRWPVPEDRRL